MTLTICTFVLTVRLSTAIYPMAIHSSCPVVFAWRECRTIKQDYVLPVTSASRRTAGALSKVSLSTQSDCTICELWILDLIERNVGDGIRSYYNQLGNMYLCKHDALIHSYLSLSLSLLSLSLSHAHTVQHTKGCPMYSAIPLNQCFYYIDCFINLWRSSSSFLCSESCGLSDHFCLARWDSWQAADDCLLRHSPSSLGLQHNSKWHHSKRR